MNIAQVEGSTATVLFDESTEQISGDLGGGLGTAASSGHKMWITRNRVVHARDENGRLL